MNHWDRVARAVRVRRGVLGLSQTQAAGLAHVTASTWRNIEGARRTGYRDGTLVMVAMALGWEPDAVLRLRDGAEEPRESQDPVLREELAELRREVESLRDEQKERRSVLAPPRQKLPAKPPICQALGCKSRATVIVERPSQRAEQADEGAAGARLVYLCDGHDKQFRQGIPVPTKDQAAH